MILFSCSVCMLLTSDFKCFSSLLVLGGGGELSLCAGVAGTGLSLFDILDCTLTWHIILVMPV